jgi:hypothetical protein
VLPCDSSPAHDLPPLHPPGARLGGVAALAVVVWGLGVSGATDRKRRWGAARLSDDGLGDLKLSLHCRDCQSWVDYYRQPEEAEANLFARAVRDGWLIEPALCPTHREDSEEYDDQICAELRAMGYRPHQVEGYYYARHRNGERTPVCQVCGAPWHHLRRRRERPWGVANNA